MDVQSLFRVARLYNPNYDTNQWRRCYHSHDHARHERAEAWLATTRQVPNHQIRETRGQKWELDVAMSKYSTTKAMGMT